MAHQFTIVMPITKYSYILSNDDTTVKEPTAAHNNFERFFRIGVATYLEHLDWSSIYEFLVLLPKQEAADFQTMLVQYVPEGLRNKFVVLPQEQTLEMA
jgi:hypothetical protein